MTPQQIEALKLALEALKWSKPHEDAVISHSEAITALEEALAEHAMRETQRLGQEIEQEPVAWVSEDVCEGQYIDGRPRKIWWECEKGVGTAFYTTPPQRTWVGLNDDEIDYLIHLAYTGDEEFVQTIEAKLKEKNT